MAKKKTGQKSDPARYLSALRRGEVLRLRLLGKTWREVAAEVATWAEAEGVVLPNGFDERYAFKDFERELERQRSMNLHQVEQIRTLEGLRLEALYSILRDLLTDLKKGGEADRKKHVREILAVSDRLIKLARRKAKMFGLDEAKLIRFIEEIDWSKMPDDVIERVANGEDPRIVMADYHRRQARHDAGHHAEAEDEDSAD